MAKDLAGYGGVFDEGFHRHILAVLCRHPSFAISRRTALDPKYFASDAQRTVAGALLRVVDEYRAVPTKATLLEAVREDAGEKSADACTRLVEKLYERDISDAAMVIDRAVAFGKQQALVSAVMESAKRITAGKSDEVGQLIADAGRVGCDILDVGVDYSNENRPKWYAADHGGAHSVLPTGIEHLDWLIDGGTYGGELWCLLAGPKGFKSGGLVNIGFNAALMGANVVYYTCELSPKFVAMRFDARLAGPHVDLRYTDPELYIEALNDRASRMVRGNLEIKGYPTRKMGISDMRQHLAILKGEKGWSPDLILVDYADIMRPERRLGEMRFEQAGIYEDLRELAGEGDYKMWTAARASNDALEKETITMRDFSEAKEKAAIVDGLFALMQTPIERNENRGRLFYAAGRRSEDGFTVDCIIDKRRCLMRSLGVYDQMMGRVMTPIDEDKGELTNEVKERLAAGRKQGSNGHAVARKAGSRGTITADGDVKIAKRMKKLDEQ